MKTIILTIILLVFPIICFAQDISTQTDEMLNKESIEDILAKAENIGPVQYEILGTISTAGLPLDTTMTTTSKIWEKMPYMRIETTVKGKTTKMIVHPDAVYFYDAAIDKYSKMLSEEMAMGFTQKSFKELAKEIKNSETLKELGTEMIDGKLTTIIETLFKTGETYFTHKMWIWNEKGIPLKTEITTKMGNFVNTAKGEHKNFIFGDISDSIFEVPKDKIIESPSM